MKRHKYIVTLVMVLLCFLCYSQEYITEAQIENYDGEVFTLSEVLEDKIYVVNLYAEWCGWCKKEWEAWNECIDEYKSEYDLEFLVLGTDRDIEEPESRDLCLISLGEFVDLNKLQIYFISQDSLYHKFGIEGLPTSFIIDQNGNVLDTLLGYHSCQKLEVYLIKLPPPITTFDNSTVYTYENRIFVQTSFVGTYELDIFSASGLKLMSSKNLKGNSSIDITGLNNQILVATFSVDNKVVKTEKLISLN